MRGHLQGNFSAGRRGAADEAARLRLPAAAVPDLLLTFPTVSSSRLTRVVSEPGDEACRCWDSHTHTMATDEGPDGGVNLSKLVSSAIDHGTGSQSHPTPSFALRQVPELGPKCGPWQPSRSPPAAVSGEQKLHLAGPWNHRFAWIDKSSLSRTL